MANEKKSLYIYKNGNYYSAGSDSLPTPSLGDAGKVLGVDNNGEFAFIEVQKPLTMTLLGYNQLDGNDDGTIYARITVPKNSIDNRTVIIFTYSNCFVTTPVSASREARVPCSLVYDDDGNARLGKMKIVVASGQYDDTVFVNTDISNDITVAKRPIAYVFALKF